MRAWFCKVVVPRWLLQCAHCCSSPVCSQTFIKLFFPDWSFQMQFEGFTSILPFLPALLTLFQFLSRCHRSSWLSRKCIFYCTCKLLPNLIKELSYVPKSRHWKKKEINQSKVQNTQDTNGNELRLWVWLLPSLWSPNTGSAVTTESKHWHRKTPWT